MAGDNDTQSDDDEAKPEVAKAGAPPEDQQHAAESDPDDEAAEDFPDLSCSKQLRQFELQACAQLATTAQLRAALRPERSQGPRGATRASDSYLTPLEAACQAGRLESVRLLLRDGICSDSRAVAMAVDSGATEVVRLLLRCRGQVNAASEEQRPPLLAAVRGGHLRIVQELCACPDTDVNARDARGASALHEAVYLGSAEMLQELLARQANPAVADGRGWTPLRLAAHLGSGIMLGQLLDAGAPIDGTDGRLPPPSKPRANTQRPPGSAPRTPPADSTGSNSREAAADCDAAGWSPLHLLLARGEADFVRRLLKRGADPCRPGGPNGVTPLMLAISSGQEQLASQLLQLPAVRDEADTQDRRGRGALHFAVAANSTLVVRSLLEVNASPTIQNENSQSPVDVARSLGLPEGSEVVQMLQVEEIVRLVMQRCACRQQNKYEESELIRGDLRIRGVSLDVQKERWALADGTWGYLSAERERAQVQGGRGYRGS